LKNRYLTIFCVILFIGISRLAAQQDLTLQDIQPFRDGDTLKCSFASPDLFDGRVGKALLSGLPVLVELHSQVLQSGTSPRKMERYRLSYDIWEDVFRMESKRLNKSFNSFEDLQKWWNPRPDIHIVETEELREGNISLKLRMRVVLLSRSQGEKLREWILNPAEVEDNSPSYRRDTGFTLNLNRLVSFFFNKDDISETFEVTLQSSEFQLADLDQKD